MRFLTKIKAKTQLPKLHFKSPKDLLRQGYVKTKSGIEPITQELKEDAYLIEYHSYMAQVLREEAQNLDPYYSELETNRLTKQFEGSSRRETYEKAAVWHRNRFLAILRKEPVSLLATGQWAAIKDLLEDGEWGEHGSDYAYDASNPGGEPKRLPEIDKE